MTPRAPVLLVAVGLLAAAATLPDPTCPLPVATSSSAGDVRCGVEVVGGVDVSSSGLGQVAVHEDLAAVVRRDEGIVSMVDLSDPAAPAVLGEYDGGTGQAQLDHPLDGDVVFSSDGAVLLHARQTNDWSNEGLHVLDVTDPTAPVRTDLAPQGGMLRVAYADLDGTEVVVTLDATHGMTVFELVRTPAGPRVLPVHVDPLPALKVGGPASGGIEIVEDDPVTGGPVLVVTDGTTGLRLFDLTDPVQPTLLGTWETQGLAAIAVEHRDGRRLVHAATEYWFDDSTPPELLTLDTTDPTAITETARRNLGGYDGDLAWKLGGLDVGADGTLWAAHGHAGLVGIDLGTEDVVAGLTDLGARGLPHPTYQFLGWYAMDVAVDGDHVVVTDAVTGELRIVSRT